MPISSTSAAIGSGRSFLLMRKQPTASGRCRSIGGYLVATNACAPTRRIGVEHE